jgi:hypothetical protein
MNGWPQQVEVADQLLDLVRRGARVQGEAGLAARLVHGLERVVHVRRGLDVHGDRVGPRRGEALDEALRPLHHQVNVEPAPGLLHRLPDRFDHRKADRDRRHEVPVHDVDMDDPRAGVHDRPNLLPKPEEVSGEDGGTDADFVDHERTLPATERGPPMGPLSEN